MFFTYCFDTQAGADARIVSTTTHKLSSFPKQPDSPISYINKVQPQFPPGQLPTISESTVPRTKSYIYKIRAKFTEQGPKSIRQEQGLTSTGQDPKSIRTGSEVHKTRSKAHKAKARSDIQNVNSKVHKVKDTNGCSWQTHLPLCLAKSPEIRWVFFLGGAKAVSSQVALLTSSMLPYTLLFSPTDRMGGGSYF